MPDITLADPATHAGPEVAASQKQAMKDFQAANYKGVWGTVVAAGGLQIPATVDRYIDRQPDNYDPKWNLDEAKLKNLTTSVDGTVDIDRDLWPMFAESQSEEHSWQIRSQLVDVMEDRRSLSAAGTFGKIAGIGASVTDPVYLVAGLATSGAGYVAGASRLANMARAGLITGTTFAGIEAARAGMEPGTGAREVLQAGAGGAVLGALGPVVEGLGRAARFGITGAAAGVTSLGVDTGYAAASGNAPDGVWETAGQQFALTGLLSALPGKDPSQVATGRAMAAAGENAVKDALYRTAKASGETLTPKGQLYLKNSIDLTQRVNAQAGHLLDGMMEDAAALAATSEPVPPGTNNALASADPKPWEVTRAEFEATAHDLAHGTSRNFDQFQDGATTRYGPNAIGNSADKFYFTDKPEVSRTFANSSGFKQVAWDKYAETFDGGGEPTLANLHEDLDRSIGKGRKLAYINDEGAIVQVEKASQIPDDFYHNGDVRLYVKDRWPRIIKTKVYGKSLDLTSDKLPEWVPDWLRQHGTEANSFAHEHDRRIIPWMRENGVAKLTVKDVFESGFRSVIALPEYIGLGRDPHRVFVEQAIADGKPVPAAVLKAYPDLQPSNAVAQTKGDAPIAGLGAASPSSIEKPLPVRKAKLEGDIDFSDVQVARPALVKVLGVPISPGMSERLANTGDNTLNLVARIYGNDHLPAADSSPAVYSGPQRVKDITNRKAFVLETSLDGLYGEHAKAAKDSGQTPLSYEDWRVQVTKAIRREPGTFTQDQTINKAADLMRHSIFKWGKDFAERHNVREFDAFPTDNTYVPRLFNRDQLLAYVNKYGHNELQSRFRDAILKADERRAATEQPGETLFPVPRITADEALGMADSQIRRGNLTGQSPEARSSKRTPMDETHSWTTPDGLAHSIEDMLHNDAATIGELYVRHTVGASAAQAGFDRISDHLRPAGEAVGPKIESRDQLLTLLQKEFDAGRELGISMPPEEFKRWLAVADALVRRTEGTPLHNNTLGVRAGRLISNANFVRSMSNIATGILNLSEMPGAFARYGWKATLNQLPSLGEFIQIIKSGQVDSKLGRDVQNMGLGVDRVASRVRRGIHSNEDGIGQATGKAEYYTARAARLASDVSLQSFGQDWMRASTGKLVQQTFLDHALSGKKLSDKRLAAMGIDANSPEFARIVQHIQDHAETAKGLAGYKLVEPNTHVWNNPDGTLDIEAIAKYRGAISRATTQAILTPDVTGYALWMAHPLARLALQFRLFAFSAWRGKLLYNIHMADRGAVAEMVIGTAAAAAGYSLVTYLRSLGRTDAQEYRDKMLAPDKIAFAAFGRASWSSLVPAAVDTTMQDILQREPVFAHSRSTGLAGGLVGGNPTIDWINSAGRSIGALQAPAFDDYEFSKKDVENISKGLFIPNLYGFQQIFQRLSEDLPDTSRSSE